ncbi:MAG: EamA family transporter [Planktomarina sp.]
MIASLSLGLVAAICWGVHDICVRYVSQRVGIYPSILTVLIVGSIVLAPICISWGDWAAVTGLGLAYASASGATFTLAGIALYKAFAIGPVRLVAPIIGSYPILSVGLVYLSGGTVHLTQGLAVLVIVCGIAIVAQGDGSGAAGSRRSAIAWSITAAIGFFTSFALGQSAASLGAELPVILLTRLVAVITVLGVICVLRTTAWPDRRQLPLLSIMGVLDGSALAVIVFSGTKDFAEYAAVTASTFGIITVILAWVFLRERMSPIQWGGVALVFAAVAYLGL